MTLKYYKNRLKLLIKTILGRPLGMEELFFGNLKPSYTILEAGAHNGTDTARFSRYTRNNIYAFEPVPSIYKVLQQNTMGCKNVSCFDIALSNANARLPMYISGGGSDASSSLLKPADHLSKNPEVTFEDTIFVTAKTLDDWAAEQGITLIDCMWLDMQGHEYNMLKASTRIFPTLKMLFTEISTTELYAGQALYPEYKAWLLQSGFKLIKEELPWGFTGNALFIRK